MNKRELTPTELTFQSFRHSQGNIKAQHYIFEYIGGAFGMLPDLKPNQAELDRYAAFITCPGKTAHIRAPKKEAAERVERAFELLRTDYSPAETKNPDELAIIATNFACQIIPLESRVLHQAKPWTNGYGEDNGRNERLRQRVLSGKSSYLYFYGRDAQPTEFHEFDALYKNSWEETVKYIGDADSPIFAGAIAEHRQNVFNAEVAILGRTVLAECPALM